MEITAVVPARNEAARIADTVEALRAIEGIGNVIVVDDASTDDTASCAREAGAKVVRLATRRGKGAALRAGIKDAGSVDVFLFIDGDLGPSATIARSLIDAVVADVADMAIAAPPATGPSGFGIVESFARWGIRALTGRSYARPLSGQRAVRREVLAGARIAPRFGVETALTIDALRGGFRVVEIPLAFEHARTGRNPAGFVHRGRQGTDVAMALLSRLRPRAARP